jgi:hypothetical protein
MRKERHEDSVSSGDGAIDPAKPLANIRQERFCQAYVGTHAGNASMAYRAAGYSPMRSSTCDVMASRMIRNDKVWSRIQWLRDENLKYVNMHRIEAVAHLRNVAMAKVTDFLDDQGNVRLDKSHPLADAVLEYVEEEKPNGMVRRKLKLKDSLKALDMLGFAEPQRVDHTSAGKPISTVIRFVDGNGD